MLMTISHAQRDREGRTFKFDLANFLFGYRLRERDFHESIGLSNGSQEYFLVGVLSQIHWPGNDRQLSGPFATILIACHS